MPAQRGCVHVRCSLRAVGAHGGGDGADRRCGRTAAVVQHVKPAFAASCCCALLRVQLRPYCESNCDPRVLRPPACSLPVLDSLVPSGRELLQPSGFTPAPCSSSAGCVLDTMRESPVLHGGLSYDPMGKTEPHALGGCVGNAPCVGEVFLFDTLAEGWESLSIEAPSVTSYPAARAGHSMASVGPTVSHAASVSVHS